MYVLLYPCLSCLCLFSLLSFVVCCVWFVSVSLSPFVVRFPSCFVVVKTMKNNVDFRVLFVFLCRLVVFSLLLVVFKFRFVWYLFLFHFSENNKEGYKNNNGNN